MFNSHITKALLIFLAAMPAINSKWWYSKIELKEGSYAASNYVANAVKNNPGRTKAAIAGIAALGGLAYYHRARLRTKFIKIFYGQNGLDKEERLKQPLYDKEIAEYTRLQNKSNLSKTEKSKLEEFTIRSKITETPKGKPKTQLEKLSQGDLDNFDRYIREEYENKITIEGQNVLAELQERGKAEGLDLDERKKNILEQYKENKKKPLVLIDLTNDEREKWKDLVIKDYLTIFDNSPENLKNFTEKEKKELDNLREKAKKAYIHINTQEEEFHKNYAKKD